MIEIFSNFTVGFIAGTEMFPKKDKRTMVRNAVLIKIFTKHI